MTDDCEGIEQGAPDSAMATARRGPISHAMFRVARLHRMVAANLLRAASLYPGQELVMMNLWDLGPQRQADLVRLSVSDAATMARTIQRLEHAGFVRRTPNTADKRSFLIEATPASRGLRAQVADIWSELEEITVGGLNEDERLTVQRVLQGLEERLSEVAFRPPP
jgi:MarR family transcriptional regulator, organic hydroperoxide resistance regulator